VDLVRRTFCDAGSLRGAPARDTVPAFDRAAAVAAALLLVFFTHPNRMLQLVPLLAAFAPGLAFVLLLPLCTTRPRTGAGALCTVVGTAGGHEPGPSVLQALREQKGGRT
jgi:hypothetical protein